MEELLNKLIEKGWKPRGEEEIKSCQIGESFYERKFIGDTVGFYEDDRGTPQWLFTKSLRDLCSKESLLWQFVCENEMVKEGDVKNFVWTRYEHTGFEPQYPLVHKWNSAEYRLIESALKDEDKLEQFLLDNIKIDE